jgi:peptidoglycan hydrolase-like protein with peptidoglycan-binding domain
MKPHTLLALRQYQKANGLKQTGKIDPSTKEALIIDILEA